MLNTRVRILYVEDDRDSLEIMSVMLRLADGNYQVIGAETAEKALRLMEEESFDLYILDTRLPKMSGIELCRLIRKKDAQTPILFYSGMVRPIDRNEALRAGANSYLIKPNDLEILEATIERLLGKSSVS